MRPANRALTRLQRGQCRADGRAGAAEGVDAVEAGGRRTGVDEEVLFRHLPGWISSLPPLMTALMSRGRIQSFIIFCHRC